MRHGPGVPRAGSRARSTSHLVDFLPERENLFHDFFDLKSELERIVGRQVDLVVARSVKNPFFKASVFASAQELYAA